MNSFPDFSGQCVGRYHLISTINSGSTGPVYAAVDTERAEKYAIKCISKFELTPKQLVVRTGEVFHHQMLTGCSPHVLPLQEIVDEDLYLFIVCSLCEGDLCTAIWQDQLFFCNDTLIRDTFLEILEGVYACHSKGVFHRDLKPANILCNKGGTDIRIADFGLATRKRICRGSRCGTPDYMSPEQWIKNSACYPSLADVWSLGIILVNMVTGRRPWKTACMSDENYQDFLDDEDYLFNTFPISWELNELLKCILRPDPMTRLRIPQIWQAIRIMDTFYRIPHPSDNAAWSREVTLYREDPFDESVPADDSIFEDERKEVSCRRMPDSPDRDFVHQLFGSGDKTEVAWWELPLSHGLRAFGIRLDPDVE